MECHPDSALALLGTIQAQTLGEASDSALYTLLLTQAQYKNFIDPTDTLPISRAAEYYQAHPANRRHLMLSLYYKGVVLYNAGHYDRAIQPLLDAEKAATTLGDHFYLGLIYRSISMVFGASCDIANSIIYSQKAWKSFIRGGNKEYADYELCNYALTLNNGLQYNLAIKHLNQLIAPPETNDTATLAFACHTIALSHYGLHHYPEVIDYYKKFQSLGYSLDNTDMQFLAISYEKIKDYTNADSLSARFDKDSVPLMYYNPYRHPENFDYKKAYYAQLRYHDYADSIFRVIVQQQVSKSLAQYRQSEENHLTVRLNLRKKIIWWCITISLIMLICGISGFFLYKKQVRRRNSRKISELETLSNELKAKLLHIQQQHLEYSVGLRQLLQRRYKLLDKLCSDFAASPEHATHIHYAKLLKSTISDLRTNDQFISSLLYDFDVISNQLFSESKTYIVFSEPEFTLLALILSGFSSTSISLLISKNIDNVYRAKYNLKTKISRSDYPRRHELISYF